MLRCPILGHIHQSILFSTGHIFECLVLFGKTLDTVLECHRSVHRSITVHRFITYRIYYILLQFIIVKIHMIDRYNAWHRSTFHLDAARNHMAFTNSDGSDGGPETAALQSSLWSSPSPWAMARSKILVIWMCCILYNGTRIYNDIIHIHQNI